MILKSAIDIEERSWYWRAQLTFYIFCNYHSFYFSYVYLSFNLAQCRWEPSWPCSMQLRASMRNSGIISWPCPMQLGLSLCNSLGASLRNSGITSWPCQPPCVILALLHGLARCSWVPHCVYNFMALPNAAGTLVV